VSTAYGFLIPAVLNPANSARRSGVQPPANAAATARHELAALSRGQQLRRNSAMKNAPVSATGSPSEPGRTRSHTRVQEHASARASSTRRSLSDVGEFADTLFITAMLIANATPMSGSRSQRQGQRLLRTQAFVART
jgi:hypothetical protein